MWDFEGLAKAALAIGAPVATLVSVLSRRRHLRAEIRENLELLEQVDKSEPLRDFGLVSGWLHGQIALDIAKLTGQKFGTDKKPIPWGSLTTSIVLALIFGAWAYWLDRDGFEWYSVFPGVIAFLFVVSALGTVTDREHAPDDAARLPPGAVLAPSDSAQERIATALAVASTGGIDDRLNPGMQADIALRFIKLLQLGAYGAAIELADPNWLICRLQAWLWNNREHFGPTEEALDALVDAMASQGSEHPTWHEFAESESRQFAAAWASLDVDHYGIAGNRRRIAADLDLVILVPVGTAGGYFVTSATAIPDAMTVLVRRTESGWRIANHLGIAPPLQAWPPVWWTTTDPTIAALPEWADQQNDNLGVPPFEETDG